MPLHIVYSGRENSMEEGVEVSVGREGTRSKSSLFAIIS
ncbi:unnamed protein product [Linum tenue]|uniref:Uncharacterized protein n=1 Tax=Linum tenue TaxID=586396 RepID=A0AAV0INH6_9ROSI|nr:unnamed protein product [Linum tenue]